MGKKVKSHSQYTDKQISAIETAASMCAHINNCKLEDVSGPIKLMFINGILRKEDSKALYKKCPGIMNIIVGGVNMSHSEFKLRQNFIPVTARQVGDALLKYAPLIAHEFQEKLSVETKLHTLNPMVNAISESFAE